MAVIKLNEDWRVRSDEYCWHLQRKRRQKEGKNVCQGLEKAGEGYVWSWHGYRYYRTLSDALAGFVRFELMSADVEGIEAIKDEIAKAENVVRRAVQTEVFGQSC